MKKIVLALLLTMAAAGCRHKAPETRINYMVNGVILAIAPDHHEITIRHDAIPGYMDGMTMPFKVKDPQILEGHKPGEEVMFQLVVTRQDAYVDALIASRAVNADETAETEHPADNAKLVHIPHIGEPIPDLVLTNQDGRRVHLKEERGKVLALNFIYTRCPLPTFCPRTMHEFSAVKQELGDLVGQKVELFTMTFDPAHDTPGILKNYASEYGAATPGWQMLTGRPEEVRKAVSFFDVNYWTSKTGAITEHTISVVIVDRQGNVARFYNGNNYDAAHLGKDIRDLLQ